MYFEIIFTLCLKDIRFSSLLASAFDLKGRNVLFNLHFVVLSVLWPYSFSFLVAYMFWVELSRIQNNYFVLQLAIKILNS